MATSEKPKAEKKTKANNKSKPETPKQPRTPTRVSKPSSNRGTGIDKASNKSKSKPETPKQPRTPNRVTKPSSTGGTGIDADHIFLLTCMEAANFRPDFVSLGEDMGVRKDAVRMRFKRLSDRIHAAIAAEQTPDTSQGSSAKEDSNSMQ